jgi:hypothetical protein
MQVTVADCIREKIKKKKEEVANIVLVHCTIQLRREITERERERERERDMRREEAQTC